MNATKAHYLALLVCFVGLPVGCVAETATETEEDIDQVEEGARASVTVSPEVIASPLSPTNMLTVCVDPVPAGYKAVFVLNADPSKWFAFNAYDDGTGLACGSGPSSATLPVDSGRHSIQTWFCPQTSGACKRGPRVHYIVE